MIINKIDDKDKANHNRHFAQWKIMVWREQGTAHRAPVPRRLEQHTSSRAIKMRGFNFDKHREPEINLVSHFPAEDTPSCCHCLVCSGVFFVCFFRNSWLLTRVGKTDPPPLPHPHHPSTNDTNPSHFRMLERGRRVRPGIKDGLVLVGKLREMRRREGFRGWGDSTSPRGFHVEEIHLLELIKI